MSKQAVSTTLFSGAPTISYSDKLRTVGRNVRRLIPMFGIVAFWQIATNAGLIDPRKLPPPSSVINALVTLAKLGYLWTDIAASLERVIIGFAIACAFGIGLGLLLGRVQVLEEYLLPIVEVLRPISVLAWIPLAIIWFGIGSPTAWFIIFLGSFFPIFSNTYLGAKSLDLVHINAARSAGANRWLFLTDVLIPSSIPYIVTGMRTGLGVGWMCVIAAELIAAQSGLGYMIQLARTLIDTEKVIAGMITIGILGYLMNAGMLLLERRVSPWQRGRAND